jgi:hypothetical protein
MKTAKQTTGSLPRPGRFSLYICAVMVLCFFNWVAINAQTVKKVNNFNSPLAVALAEVDEPAIQLQDWMMDLENGYLAVNEETELNVEPWMLSFRNDNMAGTEESDIKFEPWMVNFEQRCLVVENEDEFPVENWMVSTCAWECATRLLAGK